jgi:hypothetical protein
MSAPRPSTSNDTSTRRLWLAAAALTVVAIGLAAVALSDMRRAVPAGAGSASTRAAGAPIASATAHAEPQAPVQDPHALERARRKAMRNADARAATAQATPRMNAWSDAFAGKRDTVAPPVTVAQPAFGKGGAGEGAHVGPRLQHLAERANLTPTQVDTLAAALQDERAQVAVLRQQRQDGTLTREQARAQIDAIRSQTDSQLQHVLNAEQQAAFSEMRERRAQARAGRDELANEPAR